MTRGFVTVATGKKYRKLANNLIRSYMMNTNNPMPFSVITDHKVSLLEPFTDVIILSQSYHSYMDKLELMKIAPYDETFFIDADSLIFGDINFVFDYFNEIDGISGFGFTTDLESGEGWFDYRKMGKYKNYLNYGVGIHGGGYFIKKGKTLFNVYDSSIDILRNFSSLSFNGFVEPTDETIISLAMALNGCRPIDQKNSLIVWLPANCVAAGCPARVIKRIGE